MSKLKNTKNNIKRAITPTLFYGSSQKTHSRHSTVFHCSAQLARVEISVSFKKMVAMVIDN